MLLKVGQMIDYRSYKQAISLSPFVDRKWLFCGEILLLISAGDGSESMRKNIRWGES